jgi:acetyl esterase/lipase
MKRLTATLLALSLGLGLAHSQTTERKTPVKPKPKAAAKPKVPAKPVVPAIKPTLANVPYGSDPSQVVDFYKSSSDKPAPLMFFIHGGGWNGGSKDRISGLKECLDAGLAVVSVEYRFVPKAHAAGIKPPVKWPLEDAARALQFVRSKAAEWNIDKTRIGASGGSAGACSSLWLAFHDDMADPKSSDPVARESTRLTCAAVMGAQTTLDPQQMKEWTPNSRYGGHAFGLVRDPKNKDPQHLKDISFEAFLAKRDEFMPWIKQYSPYHLVSAGDPPIYMTYNAAPGLGQEQKDPTHTSNFGVKLQEHCKANGVPCELWYPGATETKIATAHEYLIATLKAK